jgi:hypothetical protein
MRDGRQSSGGGLADRHSRISAGEHRRGMAELLPVVAPHRFPLPGRIKLMARSFPDTLTLDGSITGSFL